MSVEQIWNNLRTQPSFLATIAKHVTEFEAGVTGVITARYDNASIQAQVTRVDEQGAIEILPCFLGQVLTELEAARTHAPFTTEKTHEQEAEELYDLMFGGRNYVSHDKWIKMNQDEYYTVVSQAEGVGFQRALLKVEFIGSATRASQHPMQAHQTAEQAIEHFPKMNGASLYDFKVSLAQEALETYDFHGDEVVGQDGWESNDPNELTKTLYLQMKSSDTDAPSTKVTFHAQFDASNGCHAYAVDAATGGNLGWVVKKVKSAP